MNEGVGVGKGNRKVFKRREIISVKQWTLENTSHNSAALKYIVIKCKRMLKVNSNISQKCGHVFTRTICLGHFTIPTQIITILLKRSCLWLVQSGLVSHSPYQAHKKNCQRVFFVRSSSGFFFPLYISVDSSWILERLSRINVSWMLRHWKKNRILCHRECGAELLPWTSGGRDGSCFGRLGFLSVYVKRTLAYLAWTFPVGFIW